MIYPWKKSSSKLEGDYRVFKVRRDTCVSPRTREEHDFFVIEAVDWVNVIAVTPKNELVMVEQYRHGSDTVELEIPGGMIDPKDASPVAAAVRELREETGYEGSNARMIGNVFPNPAIMNNRFYIVLVEDCHHNHGVQWDCTEELATRLVPVDEIPELLAQGKIRHALVVVALHTYLAWRKKQQSV